MADTFTVRRPWGGSTVRGGDQLRLAGDLMPAAVAGAVTAATTATAAVSAASTAIGKVLIP